MICSYRYFQATIGFRVSSDESPDQAAYATYLNDLGMKLKSRSLGNSLDEETGESENIQFPPTKKAKAYSKKRDSEAETLQNASKFEDAYVEMTKWMLLHMAENDSCSLHPKGIDSTILVRVAEKNPPGEPCKPQLFGCTSWGDVVQILDNGGKGYVTFSDIGIFWGKIFHHSVFQSSLLGTQSNINHYNSCNRSLWR